MKVLTLALLASVAALNLAGSTLLAPFGPVTQEEVQAVSFDETFGSVPTTKPTPSATIGVKPTRPAPRVWRRWELDPLIDMAAKILVARDFPPVDKLIDALQYKDRYLFDVRFADGSYWLIVFVWDGEKWVFEELIREDPVTPEPEWILGE